MHRHHWRLPGCVASGLGQTARMPEPRRRPARRRRRPASSCLHPKLARINIKIPFFSHRGLVDNERSGKTKDRAFELSKSAHLLDARSPRPCSVSFSSCRDGIFPPPPACTEQRSRWPEVTGGGRRSCYLRQRQANRRGTEPRVPSPPSRIVASPAGTGGAQPLRRANWGRGIEEGESCAGKEEVTSTISAEERSPAVVAAVDAAKQGSG